METQAAQFNASADIQRLEKTVECLERVVTIGQMLNSTLDLAQLLETIIQTAAELVGTEAASILLMDERTGELFFAASTGSSREDLGKIKVPLSGSLAGAIYQTGEAMIVDNVSGDSRHYAGVDQSTRFHTRSLLGIPLQVRARCIGVLEAINKLDDSPFDDRDIHMLSAMASHAAVAIENARLVASLREANRRLSDLDRLKTNFISIASHELRTPLMIVQGFASFLRDQAGGEMGRHQMGRRQIEGHQIEGEQMEGDQMARDLDMVLRGASKLQAVIDQMTNLNYLEAGLSELKQENLVVQNLVEDVAQEWGPLAAVKQQTLTVTIPPTPIFVRGDRSKIDLALSNIMNNAVKFTPENGHIALQVISHTGRVEIAVVDDGVGLPKEELGRIFDRFYQVEDHLTRQHGGLGLGLAIAKEVVEQHGGRIWAENNDERGSRFRITLPTIYVRLTGVPQ